MVSPTLAGLLALLHVCNCAFRLWVWAQGVPPLKGVVLQSHVQAIIVSPLLLGQQKQWWQRTSIGASWCTAKWWQQIRYGQYTRDSAEEGKGKAVCSPAYQSPGAEGSTCSPLPSFFYLHLQGQYMLIRTDSMQHLSSAVRACWASPWLCNMAYRARHKSQQSVPLQWYCHSSHFLLYSNILYVGIWKIKLMVFLCGQLVDSARERY